MAVPALDDRLTVLLIDQTKAHAMSSVLLLARHADPVLGDLAATEVAQRYYHSGLFSCAAALIADAADDPIAWLIEAYSLLRLAFMAKPTEQQSEQWTARLAELRTRVDHLQQVCSALSDTHVLDAEVAALIGADPPDDGYRRALDHGLPLCAFGFERLSAQVRARKIAHPQGELLANVTARPKLPGSPWTAWLERVSREG
jgi:hypothetical protein